MAGQIEITETIDEIPYYFDECPTKPFISIDALCRAWQCKNENVKRFIRHGMPCVKQPVRGGGIRYFFNLADCQHWYRTPGEPERNRV